MLARARGKSSSTKSLLATFREFQQTCLLPSPALEQSPAPVSPSPPLSAETLTARVADLSKELGLHIAHEVKQYKVILAELGLSNREFPQDFYQDIFEKNIMTFPVVLDGNKAYTIDFFVLLKWWQEDNSNYFVNPFTAESIKAIEINHSLKERIDYAVNALIKANVQRKHTDEEIAQALQKGIDLTEKEPLPPLYCAQLPRFG